MGYLFRNSHSKSGRKNLKQILEYIKDNELFYRVSFYSPIFSEISSGFEIVFMSHEISGTCLKEKYEMEFMKQGFLMTISYWLDMDCNLSIDDLLDVIDTFYSAI